MKEQEQVIDYSQPQEVDEVTQAFPARVIGVLLPREKEIPKEFSQGNTKWNKIQRAWFFKGLDENTKFYPKEGIDPEKALTHLSACQRSYEPKHQHKEAGVAYLMSLWFDDIVINTDE